MEPKCWLEEPIPPPTAPKTKGSKSGKPPKGPSSKKSRKKVKTEPESPAPDELPAHAGTPTPPDTDMPDATPEGWVGREGSGAPQGSDVREGSGAPDGSGVPEGSRGPEGSAPASSAPEGSGAPDPSATPGAAAAPEAAPERIRRDFDLASKEGIDEYWSELQRIVTEHPALAKACYPGTIAKEVQTPRPLIVFPVSAVPSGGRLSNVSLDYAISDVLDRADDAPTSKPFAVTGFGDFKVWFIGPGDFQTCVIVPHSCQPRVSQVLIGFRYGPFGCNCD